MDPNPNAWTFGDTKIFITITSGLVDMMTEEELDAVIAHECGHILCHHVLYHSIAHYVMDGPYSLDEFDGVSELAGHKVDTTFEIGRASCRERV